VPALVIRTRAATVAASAIGSGIAAPGTVARAAGAMAGASGGKLSA
jgi:hypothetical protein